MTAEKLIFIIFIAFLFALSVGIYSKSTIGRKKNILPSFLGSAALGAASLLAVKIAEIFCGELIALNLCTVLSSLLLSVPATISMLFINII